MNRKAAGLFYLDDRVCHMNMAERNEAIMFTESAASLGNFSPLPAASGISLIERVCASVHCGLADTLLANASFLEQRFLQLFRDWQSEAKPNPALASSALSLLRRLDSHVGCLEEKQSDRRVVILLQGLSQARAIFTPPQQAKMAVCAL
jgi:hypothetical protein